MTTGYWVKGNSRIRIDEEPHISAIIRNPARFGVDIDAVTFALERNGATNESDDSIVDQALHNGWIKIRRHVQSGTEQWSLVFAEFSRSRLGIRDFLRDMLLEPYLARQTISLTLEGTDDGYFLDTFIDENHKGFAFDEQFGH